MTLQSISAYSRRICLPDVVAGAFVVVGTATCKLHSPQDFLHPASVQDPKRQLLVQKPLPASIGQRVHWSTHSPKYCYQVSVPIASNFLYSFLPCSTN